MLYPLTRPLAKITLSLFFRDLYFSNADRIPKDKAVILAANHPTAFLEPCILACWLEMPIYFVVRGDLFSKPWANRILRDLHMIPVYRKKDGGLSKVKRNHKSLEEAGRILHKKHPLLVMAEGGTNGSRSLNPIQKGAARLALKTLLEDPDLDVQIVPVGVNYSKVDGFREIAMFDFGHPISASDFKDLYEENPNKGIKELTDELGQNLKSLVIQVEQPKRLAATEFFLKLLQNSRKYRFVPFYQKPSSALVEERTLSQNVNKLSTEAYEDLEDKLEFYQGLLRENKVRDLGLGQTGKVGFRALLGLLIFMIPALLGLALHVLPAILSFSIAQKKVKRKEYWSSIVAGTGMVFFTLYYLILLLVFLLSLGVKGLLAFLCIPICGLVGLWWYEMGDRWLAVRRVFQLPQAVRKILLEEREFLLSQVKG